MDRLFLDANVLFAAAYRPDSALSRLWEQPGAELVTSGYALAEARHNLESDDQRRRLSRLARRVEVVGEPGPGPVPAGVELPDAARPILRAALRSGCTHLLTGDVFRFGPYLGQDIDGLRVLLPGEAVA